MAKSAVQPVQPVEEILDDFNEVQVKVNQRVHQANINLFHSS